MHKITWTSPGGKTRNQIDYVLIESKHQRTIRKCKSYGGADVNSDYTLVIAKVKEGLSKNEIKKEKDGDST